MNCGTTAQPTQTKTGREISLGEPAKKKVIKN